MADDTQSLVAVDTAVKAVTENANRLGLTWDLRPATISQVDSTTGITVTVDGDATPIGATSMVGGVVQGQRVYVLLIPPGGVFIVGWAGTERIGAIIQRSVFTVPSGGGATPINWTTVSTSVGASFINVPSTTITIPTNGIYGITYAAFGGTGGGTRNFVGINILTGPVAGIIFRASFDPTEQFCTVSAIIPLAAGNTFQCDIFQNSGANMTNTTAILFINRLLS